MATLEDVREIASRLPGATEGEGRFGFSVASKGKAKGFLWSWAERVQTKQPKVENLEVLAIRVVNVEAKSLLLESRPKWMQEDPHYDGFPALLVRIALMDRDELEDLIIEAWRCMAPKDLRAKFATQESEP